MKIALVHSFYSSKLSSGENNVVLHQYKALSEVGNEVELFSKHTDEMDKTKFYALRSALRVSLGIGINPLNEINRFNPKLTHVHNLFPNFGFRWLSELESPIVSTLHNFRPICSAGILFRDGAVCRDCLVHNSSYAVKNKCYRNSAIRTVPLAIQTRNNGSHNFLMKFSNNLIFLSERAKTEFISAQPLLAKKSVVIPNFAEQKNDFRQNLQKRKDWIFVGRLTQEKGIVELVREWPESETLKVIGSGPLIETLKSQGKPNIIYFGNLDHEETLSLISKSKALIFPSNWIEGMPTVYLEAISSGTPVVASKGNGVSDDIEKGGAGVVYDGNLSDSLEKISLNWENYSKNALTRFQTTFSKEKWIKDTLDIYGNAIIQSGFAKESRTDG